jgi:hypothetical protein
VPSPGEHGTVKAPDGACTDNGNVVKGGVVQDVSLFVEKSKLIADFEVRAVQGVSYGCRLTWPITSNSDPVFCCVQRHLANKG